MYFIKNYFFTYTLFCFFPFYGYSQIEIDTINIKGFYQLGWETQSFYKIKKDQVFTPFWLNLKDSKLNTDTIFKEYDSPTYVEMIGVLFTSPSKKFGHLASSKKEIIPLKIITTDRSISIKDFILQLPWEIGCDTNISTQLDMNICSGKSYLIADSVLTSLYDDLNKELEHSLKKEEGYITSPSDSIQIDYVNSIKEQIEYVNQSKKHFGKFRENTIKVMSLQYDGGSMRPFVVNTYALRITVDQIETLNIMLDELKGK